MGASASAPTGRSQGCKVNAKASPLVTHAPDAIAHGVDSDHRAWGAPNLFVAGGSVMPTQGAANNPSLTIMALASGSPGRLARGEVRAA